MDSIKYSAFYDKERRCESKRVASFSEVQAEAVVWRAGQDFVHVLTVSAKI